MSARNESLDRLALGWDCPRCGAGAGEVCRTPGGDRIAPHSRRIDCACAGFMAGIAARREAIA